MKNETRPNNKSHHALVVIMMIVFVLVLLFFLFHEKTSINNNAGVSEQKTSLTCEGDNVSYSITNNILVGGNLKINLIFNNNYLTNVSLVYRVSLESEARAQKAETLAHAKMNENFAKDGLSPDSFGAVYSILNEVFQMSLYANETKINDITDKYFLLDGANGLFDQESITDSLENKGLICYTND